MKEQKKQKEDWSKQKKDLPLQKEPNKPAIRPNNTNNPKSGCGC